jgi:NAD(P)H dehydrogenase (quinone)
MPENAKLLIVYYSRTGHTEKMARTIACGAEEVPGVEVSLRKVEEVEVQSLLDFDAIILGSPTYYGTMAAEIKRLIDDSIVLHGQLTNKVGGAFTSSANVGGGNETAIMDMLKALLIHGMVIPGKAAGDHYGAVAIGDVDDRSEKQCLQWGHRIAELAMRMK